MKFSVVTRNALCLTCGKPIKNGDEAYQIELHMSDYRGYKKYICDECTRQITKDMIKHYYERSFAPKPIDNDPVYDYSKMTTLTKGELHGKNC